MNNKTEALLNRHIQRLEKDISERETDSPFHARLNEVDLKNIASLREGRIPQYSDHMDCLVGDQSIDMFEFADLSKEVGGYEWPRDPAN